MTTVAWDGTTLAADTAAGIDGKLVRYSKKLRRFADGRLAGAAGDLSVMVKLLDWLETGDDTEPPEFGKKDDADVLIVMPDGELLLYDTDCIPYEIEEGLYALGTGGDVALGAMMHGAGARQAVEYAIAKDKNSGFDVAWLTL